jgi:hypothetical protein
MVSPSPCSAWSSIRRPVERLALPAGLAKDARAAMNLAKAPARLVSRPAALPVAQPQLRERKVVERAGAGSDRARPPAPAPAKPRPCGPYPAASFRGWTPRRGAQRLGPLEDFNCLRRKRPSLCSRMPCMFTASAWSGSRARAQRSHSPGAGQILFGRAKLAPGHQRLHLLGIQREGLAQVRLRFGGPAAFPLQNRQVDPARNPGPDAARRRAARPPRQRPRVPARAAGCPGSSRRRQSPAAAPALAGSGFGLFQPSHPRQHKAGGKLALGQPRPQRQRLLVALQRLLIPPHGRASALPRPRCAGPAPAAASGPAQTPAPLPQLARWRSSARPAPSGPARSCRPGGWPRRRRAPPRRFDRRPSAPGPARPRPLPISGATATAASAIFTAASNWRLASATRHMPTSAFGWQRVLVQHPLVAERHLGQPAGQLSSPALP